MSLDQDNVVRLPVPFKPHAVERKPLDEFAKMARAHGDAFERALVEPGVRRFFSNEHVCETLRRDLAAQITALAEQATALADKAKSYSELATCANLKQVAGEIEYIAALLSPEESVE